MVASLFQVVIGLSGILGLMLRFIGPLTVVPTISLVAIPLFDTAGYYCGKSRSKVFLWLKIGQKHCSYEKFIEIGTNDDSLVQFKLFKWIFGPDFSQFEICNCKLICW